MPKKPEKFIQPLKDASMDDVAKAMMGMFERAGIDPSKVDASKIKVRVRDDSPEPTDDD